MSGPSSPAAHQTVMIDEVREPRPFSVCQRCITLQEDTSPPALEFQSFDTAVVPDAEIPVGHMARNAPSMNGESSTVGDTERLLPTAASAAPLWSLQYYQQFFDIDTEQVLSRMRLLLWPVRNSFLAGIRGRGDLYGPMWISTTLVFAIAMAGNVASYVQSTDRQLWQYDFNKVTLAATTIYSYISVAPMLLWSYLKWRTADPPSLLDVFCLYGYSLAVFVPVALVFVGLGSALRWALVAVALAFSGGSLAVNVAAAVPAAEHGNSAAASRQERLAVVAVALALHIAIAIVRLSGGFRVCLGLGHSLTFSRQSFKLYFFNV